jgi:hypothetical protein
MFREITNRARWLDTWLEENLGRPYNSLLTIGLVLDMISRIDAIPGKLRSGHDLIGTALTFTMEGALLIHQLGEFSERRERQIERTAQRKAVKSAKAPE